MHLRSRANLYRNEENITSIKSAAWVMRSSYIEKIDSGRLKNSNTEIATTCNLSVDLVLLAVPTPKTMKGSCQLCYEEHNYWLTLLHNTQMKERGVADILESVR